MGKNIINQFVLFSIIVFIVFGCSSTTDNHSEESSAYRIEWVKRADLPLPHRNGKAVACRGKIYEQKIPAVATDSIEVYDIERNEWEMGKPLREARQGVQVAAVDGKLYAIGGAYDHRKNYALSSAFERYDFESETWESLPAMPVAVLGPGIAVFEDKIFVVGGSTIQGESQDASDKVYVFDTAKNMWGEASPLPMGIQFPAVSCMDGRVYVIGGCDKEFKASASVYQGIVSRRSASSRALLRTSKPRVHRTVHAEQSRQVNLVGFQPVSVSLALCGLRWPKAYI